LIDAHASIPEASNFSSIEDSDFLWFLSATVLLCAFEVETSSNQPTSPV
jgi:hypothetical protein